MLAQSFQSAVDLGVTEPQRVALMKTLVLLETGKLRHVPTSKKAATERVFSNQFNMANWAGYNECGTISCIGGTAEVIGRVCFKDFRHSTTALHDLFYVKPRPQYIDWHDITPAQAAIALRSYLTTGDAKWHEALQ